MCRRNDRENLSALNITAGDNNNGKVALYAKEVYRTTQQSKFVTVDGGYVFFVYNDVIILCDYIGRDLSLFLPESYEGKEYAIGAAAFYNQTKITNVNVPKKVTSIGAYAFYNCSSIEGEIVIPSAQTTIEPYTFYKCEKVTKIVIPAKVTTIGEHAFYSCKSLTEFTIPQGVTSIGTNAFKDCSGIQKLYFNAANMANVTVTTSGSTRTNTVFGGMGAADGFEVIFGRYVERVPNNLFSAVIKLKKVSFEDRSACTEIGSYAFAYCTNLEELYIPESVTVLPSYLLTGCTSLKHLTIPFVGTDKNATSGANTLFTSIFGSSNYTGMKKVEQYYDASNKITRYVPNTLEKVTVLGGNVCYNAFYFVTMIDEIELGENVGAVIGEKAFYACYDLKKIIVNGYITEIGADAFIYSGIETVVLSSQAFDIWEQIVFANDNSDPTKLGATILAQISPGGNMFA